jgi:hypothetical protein
MFISDFAALLKAKAASRGDDTQFIREAGLPGQPYALQTISKLAVPSTPLSELGDYRALVAEWAQSLSAESVFFRLYDGLGKRMGFYIPVNALTLDISGYLKGEGLPIPVSLLQLSRRFLSPQRAAALIVTSDEFAQAREPSVAAGIEAELRTALVRAVDGIFLAGLVDSATPVFAATGTSPQHALADLRTLLNAINTVGNPASGMMFAMSVGTANALSVLSTGGGMLFPGLSPTGGELLGLPAIVTDRLTAGDLMLLRGADIAVAFSGIEIDTSRQASLQLADDPAGTAATMASLWQNGASATRAVAGFNYDRLKDNAAGVLTGSNSYVSEASA